MFARSTAVGILSVVALHLPGHLAHRFTLDTTGAVRVAAVGQDARYGVIADEGPSILTVSLGATGRGSALQLRMRGTTLPAPGRYPIGTGVQAFLAAGSPEHPLGWFHGESGTVTITRAAGGQLSGSFEIEARGFLAADPTDAERWVTVTGSFEAEGESTATAIAAAR